MSNKKTDKKYEELRQLGYKTNEELNEELRLGQRKSITQEDLLKSEELKRILYPDWIVYPKGGEIYEAIDDVEVLYMTSWGAPFTGGGNVIFPKGETIKVATPNRPKPTSVYCEAVNYKKLHHLVVPEKDRSAPDYGGYYFAIETLTLNTKFKFKGITDTKRTFFQRIFGKQK